MTPLLLLIAPLGPTLPRPGAPMPPADPDEAREQILRELSKSMYDDSEGFIPWLLRTIEEWLLRTLADAADSSPGQIALTVAAVVLLVVVTVLLMRRTGMIRRSGPLTVGTAVQAEPELRASLLRERAERALTDGQHDDAVVLALRSLVRDLEERTLLEATDGLTAHEAAARAALPFPDLSGRLLRLADAFDTAAYSRRSVSTKQADDAVRLIAYIAQARPQLDAEGTDADTERADALGGAAP